MSDFTTAFKQSPLDPKTSQIRLVHLQPHQSGDGDGPIVCSLHIIDLDETPKTQHYEALSYEWGEPSNTALIIYLNGSVFPVRDNLWWALLCLRTEKEVRVLWIDAICINQANSMERNHQVQQMGSIYSGAECVIAWLGREYDGYSDVLRRKASTDIKDLLEFFTAMESSHSSGRETPRKRQGGNIDQAQYGYRITTVLRKLCISRRYWQRLWILQELILAKHIVVQCGHFELPWHGFERAVARIPFNKNDLDERAHAVYESTIAGRQGAVVSRICSRRACVLQDVTEQRNLLDIVFEFSEAKCEDLRDKVFGLHSLARKCCQQALAVDYTRSAGEICKTLVLHHLRCHTTADGTSIGGNKVEIAKIARLLQATNLDSAPLLWTIPNSDLVARVACTQLGRVTLVDSSMLKLVTWKDVRGGPLYQQLLPNSLKVLTACKQNPQRDWLLVEVPSLITDTGVTGNTVFEVQNGDYVYGFKSIRRGAFILREEMNGYRLVGIATLSTDLSRTGGILAGESAMSIKPCYLYLDLAAVVSWESIFERAGAGAERQFLIDVWPRWYIDHISQDLQYIADTHLSSGDNNTQPDGYGIL